MFCAPSHLAHRPLQWSPEYNYDSDSATVNPGDVLHGIVTFNEANQSYTAIQSDLNSGWSVTAEIPVQQRGSGSYKNYTIGYVVMEKVRE